MAVWLAGGGGDHHHDAVHIRVETHHLDLHLQRGSRGSPCLQNLSGINLCDSPFSIVCGDRQLSSSKILLLVAHFPEP